MSATKQELYHIIFPEELKEWDIVRWGEGTLNEQAVMEFYCQLKDFTESVAEAISPIIAKQEAIEQEKANDEKALEKLGLDGPMICKVEGSCKEGRSLGNGQVYCSLPNARFNGGCSRNASNEPTI